MMDAMRLLRALLIAVLTAGPSSWRAAPFVVAPLVGVYGMTRLWSAGATPVASAEGVPRFAIVCAKCGHREDRPAPPGPEVERRAGKLRCAACQEFRAAWYRRGGLSLPPGGW